MSINVRKHITIIDRAKKICDMTATSIRLYSDTYTANMPLDIKYKDLRNGNLDSPNMDVFSVCNKYIDTINNSLNVLRIVDSNHLRQDDIVKSNEILLDGAKINENLNNIHKATTKLNQILSAPDRTLTLSAEEVRIYFNMVADMLNSISYKLDNINGYFNDALEMNIESVNVRLLAKLKADIIYTSDSDDIARERIDETKRMVTSNITTLVEGILDLKLEVIESVLRVMSNNILNI